MIINQINRRLISRFRRLAFESNLKALAFVVPVLLLAASCGESVSERVEKVGGVTARQVIENPTAYVGKTVTVSGNVEEIHGPQAFNMDSGVTMGELLVVGREPFVGVPERGNTAYVVSDVATVTGVVRMLVAAEVEREIGWDLDPEIEAEFNAKPVLIAQNVSFRAGAGRQPEQGEIVDYLVIVTAPDQRSLVGRRVKFTDVKVQSVIGDRTFYIGPDESQRVLVVLEQEKTPGSPVEGKVDVNAGQTVSFSGVVERMPGVEEAGTRFGRLTSKSELDKFRDQPVFIRTDKVNIKAK
ncbi:MAG TPA: hypothetical protein VFZ23_07895 [Pyrinomonadaceae bacterium]